MRRIRALLLAIAAAGCAPTLPPSPTATPGPTVPEQPCAVSEQSGPLFSNTLVGIEVGSDGLSDFATFTLGDPAGPFNAATGILRPVEPPFVEDGSGEEVDVLGEHHVELRLEAMSLFDDAGNPTFVGEGTITPDLLTLKQVELTGAFEGIFSFVIGYVGSGCVALNGDEANRTLTIRVSH